MALLNCTLIYLYMKPYIFFRCTAFQLHHREYDVWLANLRGVSPYGRQHIDLTDVMVEFWRFSFHEHGAYDLPAIIDHMAKVTGGEQLASRGGPGQDEEQIHHQVVLIGHSQVSAAYFQLANSSFKICS